MDGAFKFRESGIEYEEGEAVVREDVWEVTDEFSDFDDSDAVAFGDSGVKDDVAFISEDDSF